MPKLISPDKFLTDKEGYYSWSPKASSEAWTRCYRELGRTLGEIEDGRLLMTVGIPASGKSSVLQGTQGPSSLQRTIQEYDVAFDATFRSRISRSAILNLSIGAGWGVDCLYLDTPIEVCLGRQESRSERKVVPPGVILGMHSKLDVPELSEGFRRIYVFSRISERQQNLDEVG